MENVKIIGTSHISSDSVRKVRETILNEKPDCVAVELCPERYYSLISGQHKTSIRFGLLVWILSKIQEDLSRKTGLIAGSEMMAAIKAGKEVGAQVVLIDRPIRYIIYKLNSIPLRKKLGLFTKIIEGLIFSRKVKIDLRKVPEDGIIEAALDYMKKELPDFYKVLVIDRNKYMSEWIKKLSKEHKNVIVVVGAGHKKDLESRI